MAIPKRADPILNLDVRAALCHVCSSRMAFSWLYRYSQVFIDSPPNRQPRDPYLRVLGARINVSCSGGRLQKRHLNPSIR